MTLEPTSLRGKNVRFSWTDGPTKGKTYEHVFHEDGTVEWHSVDGGKGNGRKDAANAERPKFVDESVADGVRMVSYLSDSGYTLTAVLNFSDKSIVGVASNEKTWTPVHGSFDIVG
jgi:hypothetical protein